MVDQDRQGGQNFVGSALGALGVGVWSWCDTPANVRCCPVVARLFGLPAATAWDGLPLKSFAAGIHPEDRERFEDLIARARVVGGPFVAEYRTIPAQGVERWILDRGEFELGTAGCVVAARGIVIDMTDRVDQESVKGNAFFSPGFQNLSRLDRAVEHALALSDLIDVVPGASGQLAGALTNQILTILGGELAASVRASEAEASGASNAVH